MTKISSNPDQMKSSYTAVVVGSGYGRGIAASRLARAGQSVCVLKRGQEIRPGDYPNSMAAILKQTQVDTRLGHEGSRTALFDFRINKGMSALVGCVLGIRRVSTTRRRADGAPPVILARHAEQVHAAVYDPTGVLVPTDSQRPGTRFRFVR